MPRPLPAFLAAIAFTLSSTPILAQVCEGQNVLEERPAEYLERLEAAVAKQPYNKGRFFEVSRNGAKSILFGTIHLPDPDVAIIPPRLEMEIRRSSKVFIEITQHEEQRMQKAFLLEPSLIRNDDGRRISELVSRAELDALTLALGTHGLTLPVFDELEPWFLNLIVAVPQCVTLRQAKGGKILDRLIEQSAQRAEIPVEGLEEYDEILGILSSGTYEEQVQYLMMGLPLLEQAGDALEVTKRLYMSGEITKIWEFSRMEAERVFKPEKVRPVFREAYDHLVTTRNQNWMDTLLPALEEGGAVVAVGALHLGGRSGLLPMLEAEGFTIAVVTE